ncbi:hypothetical protein SPRG_22340 [Saprolegnia parasitica CBS 223.65]|uniref:Cationic amino acid transporter C-terminal domain-containing protein n=1 Tax=Saprolegnia parasitica (strain CBS 223.65) TaxID=695850 RepID=A0A067C2Y0_SAPPC|nr:hypothetical protein SPRG_22340 [Saprolegnia parasitica CBS 223.65]KDO20911.1 hypothetical protein SPRG_22340 [Saprolegnia parasitica CBS 223.65]|eukprot:XP_012208415.1 hypothetical protein SPRG_22340 [Saprolegnia parasitica CBS 223.65]
MGLLTAMFRTKPIAVIDAEERKEELPRELGLVDLILIGVGSTVGSGVFATTGDIISQTAGAAAFLSWLIAGFSCILNGFAYMEMSSLVPSSGSTYAYSYYGLGELPAVVAGWLLTLEYGICSAGVARSWADKVHEWPRVLYAMAVDGLCPPIFGKVDKKGNLFWNTLITGVFFTIIALLVPFDYLWNLVSLGILVGFNMTNSALILVRTRESAPTIAYKLTGALVAVSLASMFLFQKGYVIATEPATGYLIASMLLLAAVVVITFGIYFLCPQNVGSPDMYRSPLVPFVPALAITCNWYLIAQMGARDIGLCCGWVGLAILSYFVYGHRYSEGQNGWAAMLHHEYTGLNSVRPSLTSQIVGEKKESILGLKLQVATSSK